MDFVKGLGKDLYLRVFVSWRSTLLFLALSVAGEVVTYVQNYNAPWVHYCAGVLTLLGLMLKSAQAKAMQQAIIPPPPPPVTFGIMLALMLLGAGCSTLSRVSGTTGALDLGKGYVCSATAGGTDTASCTKLVSTVCDGPNGFHSATATSVPVPRDAAGVCP